MQIIDSSVHLAPGMMSDRLVDTMFEAGVDAALILNQTKFGPDNTHQLQAAQLYPDRFAVIGGVDLTVPDLDAEINRLKAQPGIVGLRAVIVNPDQLAQAGLPTTTLQRLSRDIDLWNSGAYSRLFAVAEKKSVPMCVFLPGRMTEIAPICRAHPDLQIVIDNLNLDYYPPPADPFQDLAAFLELAKFPNLAVKASGTPVVSSNPFPFRDLWPHFHKIISAFGLDRVMWGSYWPQSLSRCTYIESVEYMRSTSELSAQDKEMLMGQSLRRIFAWPT